jgi:hypothetical protein
MSNDQGQFESYALKRARVNSDTLLATGAGFIKSITISQADAAPTAGSIVLYDATAAEVPTTNVIFRHTFTTTAFTPFTIPIEVPFDTGLYVDFVTTRS